MWLHELCHQTTEPNLTSTDNILYLLCNDRYKYRQVSRGSAEELEEMGVKMNKSNDEISLESEYQKVKDNLDIENWEQVRGPRPWEEEPPPEKK